MKIGIIIPSPILSPTGGVKIQAEMWRDGFNMLGHEGILINAWEIRTGSRMMLLSLWDLEGLSDYGRNSFLGEPKNLRWLQS